jgi:protein transport protein SEC24
MRIRCSRGLRISSFHGHFFIRSTDLLALPTVDGDKAYAVQIAHEENVMPASHGYIQCALLYTSSGGERRIRVHTMCVPVVSDLGDMYKAADGPCSAALLARLAVEKSLNSRLEDARQAVAARVVAVLKEYKSLYSTSHRMPNKLVLPEGLKLIGLYALTVMKCKAMRGGAKDVALDDRAAVAYAMMAMSLPATLRFLYPTLYALHTLPDDCCEPGPDGAIIMPTPVALASEVLDSRGVYLLDDGRILIAWVGRAVPAELLQDLFGAVGVADPLLLDVDHDSALSKKVQKLLGVLRTGKDTYQQCFVVRQGDAIETHWMPYLVEDRIAGTMSYTEFLCHIHRNTSK